MGYRLLTNCQHLDRHNGCRHPARRRSKWHPLRWVGLDRPGCVFFAAEFHRDGPEAIRCPLKVEIPRPPPPHGCPAVSRSRPATVALVAIASILTLGGCGESGDRIQETRDPCEFVLDFGTRCIPAGKTAICTHRRTIIARSTARECTPTAE